MEFNNEQFLKEIESLSEQADHNQLNSSVQNTEPKPEKMERGNGVNDRPHKGEPSQTNDEEINIPGPDELPDQQKVGEDIDDETFKRDHIDT